MRIERKFLHWGHDLTPSTLYAEADLTKFGKLKTSIDFRGRSSVEEQIAKGIQKKVYAFRLDEGKASLWGGEGVYLNNERVGNISSGG